MWIKQINIFQLSFNTQSNQRQAKTSQSSVGILNFKTFLLISDFFCFYLKLILVMSICICHSENDFLNFFIYSNFYVKKILFRPTTTKKTNYLVVVVTKELCACFKAIDIWDQACLTCKLNKWIANAMKIKSYTFVGCSRKHLMW